MTSDHDEATWRAVGQYRSLDPYVLWRALKDLENEIYSLERANEPIPIKMLRMRAAMRKAKEKGAIILAMAPLNPPNALSRNNTRSIRPSFDPFDFVDQYRTLGGLRRAIAWGENVRVFAWDEDSREATDFWDQRFPALSRDEQQAVAACLLERGRS
ncbi:hypothetical protein [Mesorhizobium sp. WSM2239]|uniref:Uncharacterized protein n=2 Tax=unclassified Mesorhizobium TaxID=325217 RepID=A0AAU8DIX6_9HYPH